MKVIRRHISLMLALRYLNPLRSIFSVMTLICLVGVSLGVMVLIVVLSVMEGLQRDMAEKVLTFTPHYVVSQYDQMGQFMMLDDEEIAWQDAIDKMQAIPGVRSVYPKLESDAYIQSSVAGTTYRFQSVDPENKSQMDQLTPLLREGSFDFGAGYDYQCVISSKTAEAIQVRVGDMINLNPVGSLSEFEDIYRVIVLPLQTHENQQFMQDIGSLFEKASKEGDKYLLDTATLQRIQDAISALPFSKLRHVEIEICTSLEEMINSPSFNDDLRQRWEAEVTRLKNIDRHRENGLAIDSINELVMPIDLEVIGIYQAPGNFPGPALFMPLYVAQEALGYSQDGRNMIQGISIRLDDAHATQGVEAPVRDIINQSIIKEGIKANDWQIIPWTNSLQQWFKLIANERTMMNFVLSIISLIAAFCIMAVMFTMSMQRKREIAVMQALGATPWKIMLIFIWQGLIIGFFGAVLGVVLALLVLHYRLDIQWLLANMGLDPFPMEAHGISLPVAYNVNTFVNQALIAFIMVLIASIIPAYCVSRQDASKALRSN